jgi:hypothetical protein
MVLSKLFPSLFMRAEAQLNAAAQRTSGAISSNLRRRPPKSSLPVQHGADGLKKAMVAACPAPRKEATLRPTAQNGKWDALPKADHAYTQLVSFGANNLTYNG